MSKLVIFYPHISLSECDKEREESERAAGSGQMLLLNLLFLRKSKKDKRNSRGRLRQKKTNRREIGAACTDSFAYY